MDHIASSFKNGVGDGGVHGSWYRSYVCTPTWHYSSIDIYGNTPLDYACDNHNIEIVKYLLQKEQI